MHVSGEELETSADPYDTHLPLLLMPINVTRARTDQYTCKWLCTIIGVFVFSELQSAKHFAHSFAQMHNLLFSQGKSRLRLFTAYDSICYNIDHLVIKTVLTIMEEKA